MIQVLQCTVNNRPVELGIDPRESLADVLRQRLGLTSVKKGCEVGECGACTVLVDGTAIDSARNELAQLLPGVPLPGAHDFHRRQDDARRTEAAL